MDELMTSNEAAIILKDELNKLDSKDFQNIQPHQMQDAVNEERLNFVRRRIDAKEINIKFIDDLQVLLKSERLAGSNKGVYFKSHKLPLDYMGFSRNTVICSKGNCENVRIKSALVEDANVDEYLQDANYQPSFDFEQTFHTLSGNKIYQYHNNDFTVDELELSYYRIPQKILFQGAYQMDGTTYKKNMTWEFKEDVCRLIISGAAMVLASRIKDKDTYQTAANKIQLNK